MQTQLVDFINRPSGHLAMPKSTFAIFSYNKLCNRPRAGIYLSKAEPVEKSISSFALNRQLGNGEGTSFEAMGALLCFSLDFAHNRELICFFFGIVTQMRLSTVEAKFISHMHGMHEKIFHSPAHIIIIKLHVHVSHVSARGKKYFQCLGPDAIIWRIKTASNFAGKKLQFQPYQRDNNNSIAQGYRYCARQQSTFLFYFVEL